MYDIMTQQMTAYCHLKHYSKS